MKLLIISNMSHHYRDGVLVGHGATVREIDSLAEIFDEVWHIGCLHTDEIPKSELPYQSDKLRFIPLPPSGGETLRAKLGILLNIPLYIATIWKYLSWADVVHVRAPANIPLIAILLLAIRRQVSPCGRWVKYAGNWDPNAVRPKSYGLQRYLLLRNWHRGLVTVNGEWQDQPHFVRSFLNPCLTNEEVVAGQSVTNQKNLTKPIKLIFVGALTRSKGVGHALHIARLLRDRGIPFRLDIIGDGSERSKLEGMANNLELSGCVDFHGSLPRQEINPFYAQSHFILFPSESEGWPKVISEAMAFGVVPLAADVSAIAATLGKFGTGVALQPDDYSSFVVSIHEYLSQPERWQQESENSLRHAHEFTYDTYINAVRSLLNLHMNKGTII